MKPLFRLVILFLLIITLISTSFAYNCTKMVDDVIGLEVPTGIPYSNERFNIFVDGVEEGFIIIENKNITDAGCFIIEEPTYNVQIDSWETIEQVSNSTNPIDALTKVLNGNEIELKGVNVIKSVKAVFTEMMITIFSWFV